MPIAYQAAPSAICPELMVHVHGSVCTHVATFTIMQYDDEVQLIINQLANVAKLSTSEWVEIM